MHLFASEVTHCLSKKDENDLKVIKADELKPTKLLENMMLVKRNHLNVRKKKNILLNMNKNCRILMVSLLDHLQIFVCNYL